MEEKCLKDVKMVIESAKVDNVCITIPKYEIEKWIEQYQKVGKDEMENGCPTWRTWFYWGKREVLVDLLKQINNNEKED